MALYYFDITNHGPVHRDDTGTECANMAEIRKAARASLPEIAKDQIPADGEQRIFTVVVRDEDGNAVYTATMTYVGMRLDERPYR